MKKLIILATILMLLNSAMPALAEATQPKKLNVKELVEATEVYNKYKDLLKDKEAFEACMRLTKTLGKTQKINIKRR